ASERHFMESISISSSMAGDSLRIALARTSTTQEIRAPGCARLSAATAGSVCTTSPIELSFTTRILIMTFDWSSHDYNSWVRITHGSWPIRTRSERDQDNRSTRQPYGGS